MPPSVSSPSIALDRNARRLVKFSLVGASGVFVTLAVNALLHAFVGMPLPVSTALAVEAAIFTNFLGNHHWTFAGADVRHRTWPRLENAPLVGPLVRLLLRPTVRRFAKFNAVSLVGLVLTTAVTTYVAARFGTELRALAGNAYFLLANLAGIGVAMTWNFVANAKWTWR